MMLFLLLSFFLVPGSASINKQSDEYYWQSLSHVREAMCIDGTPFGYYFQNGTGSGRNNYLVYMKGGGWCESLEDCYKRSKTALGSSKSYKPTMKVDDDYFSVNPKLNPTMWNWNKIWIPYCDGGSFSGNNYTATPYNGIKLHFRGHINVQAVINDAHSMLAGATNVVISGSSAGGLATYLHVDEWANSIPVHVKVVGLPDSGFFLDYEDALQRIGSTVPGHYQSSLKWVFHQMNSSAGVNQECLAHYQGTNQESNCIFAQHSAQFIKTPTFALQSQYDSWQLGHEVTQPFTHAQANHYGMMVREAFNRTFLANSQFGAHFGSCYHHTRKWDAMHIDGDTPAVAFSKWFNGQGSKTRWISNKIYPCDQCCK